MRKEKKYAIKKGFLIVLTTIFLIGSVVRLRLRGAVEFLRTTLCRQQLITVLRQTTLRLMPRRMRLLREEEPVMDPVRFQVFYPVAVDAPIAAILNGYIEDFQAEFLYITVEPVFSGGYGDVQTAIQTTIDGGGEPPALGVMLATALYDLINADYISSLDGYIAGMDDGQCLCGRFPAGLLGKLLL